MSALPAAPPPTPTALDVIPSAVPDELRQCHQWVAWHWKLAGDRWTKVPINARTGAPADTTDAATWASFDEALHFSQRRNTAGIGFVFTKDDPYAGVDLDQCRAPHTGVLEAETLEIIRAFHTYAEASPSGTGVKLFLRGHPPGERRRKGQIEIYNSARFFTVTGHRLPEAPTTVEDCQEALDRLALSLFPSSATHGNGHQARSAPLTDWEVLRKATTAKNGGKVRHLLDGDISGYGSHSEADLALLGALAFYTQEAAQLERLWHSSGLWREKCKRADYRELTLKKALDRSEHWGASLSGPAWTCSTSSETRERENAESPHPFPVDALPNVLAALVREGAAALDVDPAFIAVPLLGLAGGTIGKRYCLEVKRGHREWPIVYAGIVGSPGSGKSPAAALARSAVDRLQREAWDRYQAAMEVYHRDKSAHDALTKKERAGQEPPHEPMLDHYFTTDTTIEALGKMLSSSPGVTVPLDELVSWVKSCDQYRGGKGSDRQKWLSGWSKDPWKIDRKGGTPLYIPNPVVCVIGGIQPDVLKDLKHEAGARDGFIERILWAYPADHFPEDTEDEVDEATLFDVYRLFEKLRPAGQPASEDESMVIRLSEDARTLWKGWRKDNTRLLGETAGLAQGVYAKLPSQAARLALILHCLTYPDRPAQMEVSAATLTAALDLTEYFRAHALRVLPQFGQDDARGGRSLVSQVAAILDHAGGAWVARSAIRDALHRNPTADEVGEALARLAEQGRAERRVNLAVGMGRPPEEWRSLVTPLTRKRGNAESPLLDDKEREWRA